MTKQTFRGTPIDLAGSFPQVGDQLPNTSVTGNNMEDFQLADLKGQRLVLNIFPSLDTGVCAASVRHFNEAAADLDNTVVLNLSKDLPFAQARFCGAEGIDNVQVASAFRTSAGEDLGVTMLNGPVYGLLARSVIVADDNHQVIYTEQVEDMTNEPNYEAALNALK